MSLRLIPVPLLDTLDHPAAWMYDALHLIAKAAALDVYGSADGVSTAGEWRIDARDEPATEHHLVLAVDGDDRPESALGFARCEFPLQSNPRLAYLDMRVLPEARRQGIGTRLADWAETTAARAGRTSWVTWTRFDEPIPGTPVVRAAEGDAMPADSPGLLFALARGYTLRQIERRSRLDLPVSEDLLSQLYAAATPAEAPYRFHQWSGVPPTEWLDQLSILTTAMTTDQPMGGLTMAEDPWDPGRLRAAIARNWAKGHADVTTVAEHIPTGELVALTDIIAPRTPNPYAEQDDTIVRRDHRGHGLGMAIKILNLRRVAGQHPWVERIYTWNASENTHMLAINTALGFRPAGGSALLQQGDA